MIERVWTSGRTVQKRFDHHRDAAAAVARAQRLRAAGLSTPSAWLHGNGRIVGFDLIAGLNGSRLVGDAVPRHLAAMLAPVAKLHAIAPPDGLVRHDPLARIAPRLQIYADAHLRSLIASLMAEIGRNAPGQQTLHGDLHAGQMIMDRDGEVWLVDLDDMAIGHAAADLGNFSAHLATRCRDATRSPVTAMRSLLETVMTAYPAEIDASDARLAEAYGRLALIRRGLKFRQRGDGHLLATILDEAGP